MILSFGRYAREKRLVKALRGPSLERSCLEELLALLRAQPRREVLPWGLLWKMHVLAEKALHKLPEDDARYPLLREIRRGALWEIQSREMRGV